MLGCGSRVNKLTRPSRDERHIENGVRKTVAPNIMASLRRQSSGQRH